MPEYFLHNSSIDNNDADASKIIFQTYICICLCLSFKLASTTALNLYVTAYSDLKIRLVNGPNNKTGTVEIFHPSFGWGNICDDDWNNNSSAVVCRQLSFDGVNATRVGNNGREKGWSYHCTGNESYIWDCSHSEWYFGHCNLDWKPVVLDCY